MSDVLTFYRDEPNPSKYTFSEVISWDDKRLEKCHDYIQWLFPTDAPSRFNANAPVLDAADIQAFKEDRELQFKLKEAEDKIRWFWCLDRPNMSWWARAGNHNLLRISRVIRCLKLLAGDDRARRFLADVKTACEGKSIGPSGKFWQEALDNE